MCDLVVESLSRIYKILGPIPSTVREKKSQHSLVFMGLSMAVISAGVLA